MSSHTKALFAILIAALLWSTASSVGKLLVAQASPFVVATYRFGVASLCILPFFLKEKKPKGYIKNLLPLGIFNAGNILFYYSGLALTTANSASIIGTSVPLVVALLSPILIHESVNRKKWFGIIVGLLGTLFIIFLPILQKNIIISGNLLGNIFLLAATICWSLYIITSRFALFQNHYSSLLATSINIFFTTFASLTAAILTHQSLSIPALKTPTYLGVLLFAAIGITLITFFLFQWGVQYVSAATASLKENIQLVIGVGINALVLGEKLTFGYFVGGILVLVGVLIATKSTLSKRYL